jgi:hypothetical protein
LINRKNDYSPGACPIRWALGETPSITGQRARGGTSTLMARGLFVTVRGNFQHSLDAGTSPRVASSAILENPKGAKGIFDLRFLILDWNMRFAGLCPKSQIKI